MRVKVFCHAHCWPRTQTLRDGTYSPRHCRETREPERQGLEGRHVALHFLLLPWLGVRNSGLLVVLSQIPSQSGKYGICIGGLYRNYIATQFNSI